MMTWRAPYIRPYIWVGRQTPADMLKACFGVDHVDQINSATMVLPQIDNPSSAALNAFLNCMRKARRCKVDPRLTPG